MRILGLVLACLGTGAPAAAAELALAQVLESSARAMPALLAADADVMSARGELLSATGEFDRRLELSTDSWVNGYYDGVAATSRFVVPLRRWGADLYTGYRVSSGSFPVYEDELVTQVGGEVAAGIRLPLLRGRAFDARRQQLLDAELGTSSALIGRQRTRLEVQHAAATRYWQWVGNGLMLQVFRDLGAQAQARDEAFRERLRQGAVAEIDVVENARALLRRRELVREAELALELSAQSLSLYLRDESGSARIPVESELPAAFPPIEAESLTPDAQSLERALAARPELRSLDIAARRARARARLADNDMLPSVDLNLKLSQDLGTDTLTRDDFEWVAAIDLKVPIERRYARGRAASARATLDRIDWETRLYEERIGIEFARIRARLAAAESLAELAQQEAALALRLEVAERRRFDEGASTFFLVNQREQTAADALIRVLEADRRFFEAVADFWLVTADARQLGLPSLD